MDHLCRGPCAFHSLDSLPPACLAGERCRARRFRAYLRFQLEFVCGPLWRHVSLRLFTVGIVIAGAYLLAKIAADALEEFESVVRNAYTWAAAFFVGFLIWYETPYAWIAVFFLAAGIILALVGRRWNLPHLGFQEHFFAIAAVARTFDYNYHLTTHYGNFSVRILTVSIVAAGLYAISRKATAPDAPYALSSAYLHTTAATSLLALLMWYEVSPGQRLARRFLGALYAVRACLESIVASSSTICAGRPTLSPPSP